MNQQKIEERFVLVINHFSVGKLKTMIYLCPYCVWSSYLPTCMDNGHSLRCIAFLTALDRWTLIWAYQALCNLSRGLVELGQDYLGLGGKLPSEFKTVAASQQHGTGALST